jgi:hypothetical protein
MSWVRRSRGGWLWASGSDTPLGEETERYRLRLSSGSFERTVVLEQSSYVYSVEQQAADGVTGALRIEVVQIGTYAASRPSILIVN